MSLVINQIAFQLQNLCENQIMKLDDERTHNVFYLTKKLYVLAYTTCTKGYQMLCIVYLIIFEISNTFSMDIFSSLLCNHHCNVQYEFFDILYDHI